MSETLQSGGTSRSDFWELDGHRAILHTGRLVGMIDLTQPSRGLTAIRVDGAAIVGSLMGVDVSSTETRGTSADEPWTIADAYIRGRDLVATYREPRELPFNLQLYWRTIDAADGTPMIDLICSVQTPLWEAHPGVKVESTVFENRSYSKCGDDAGTLRFDLMVAASPQSGTYVETSRKGDFNIPEGVAKQVTSCKHWQYGPQFMEKGVIRRLQLRGAFVTGGNMKQFALKLAEELAAEEPALTA